MAWSPAITKDRHESQAHGAMMESTALHQMVGLEECL